MLFPCYFWHDSLVFLLLTNYSFSVSLASSFSLFDLSILVDLGFCSQSISFLPAYSTLMMIFIPVMATPTYHSWSLSPAHTWCCSSRLIYTTQHLPLNLLLLNCHSWWTVPNWLSQSIGYISLGSLGLWQWKLNRGGLHLHSSFIISYLISLVFSVLIHKNENKNNN